MTTELRQEFDLSLDHVEEEKPKLEKRITRYGFIADLVKARKSCVCRESHAVILKGEYYYRVIVPGGGLGSIKFPNKVKTSEIDKYLDKYRESWEKTESIKARYCAR